MRGLAGFERQGMDGRRKLFRPYTANFPPGSHTWTSPRTAYYRFTQWGPGGSGGGGAPGASGALTQNVVLVPRGQTVAIAPSDAVGVDSTITFANGKIATAGSGVSNTPGVASGGDLNLNGSVGGAAGLGTNGGAGDGGANGGGGAPGQGPYKGAAGGTHGPGAGFTNGSIGGYGFCIIASQANSLL
jgi:hypothetical protein